MARRFSPADPCPVCGGHDKDPRGAGRRCFGFLSVDGAWAHCSREEHAGGLPVEGGGTYAHWLAGACKCGKSHGAAASAGTSNGYHRGGGRRAEIVATYDYRDPAGKLRYQAIRRADKTFALRRPQPGGGWIWDVAGVERLLYRLPELLAADPARPVFIVEGEKDADALAALGLTVTTNSEGAEKWPAAQSRHLAGRRCILIPDNDVTGRKHVAQVRRAVAPFAASVAVLELGGLPPKGDVSDWLAAGGTAEAVLALAEAVAAGDRQPGDDGADGDAEPGQPNAQPAPEPPTTAVGAAWIPLDPAFLEGPAPPRRWLLRRPTRNDEPCEPALGDGLLPLGKVGLFVADGGIGKTMALVALGLSIITGRPWLNYFHVPAEAQLGKVLLALAEEDREEVHRRLFPVVAAYGLTAAEKAAVVDRLVALPLTGSPVRLVDDDGNPTAELLEIQARLAADPGAHGWSLVVLDPFARFAAPTAEIDNAVATRTVQAAESLIAAPGSPTVLIAHHTPAEAIRSGAIRARGVTGIRDAARWEAVLRADGRDVYFQQTKSNYSRGMPEELLLVREAEGILRVATDDEAEARAKPDKEAARDARREEGIARLMDDYVSALMAAAEPPTTQRELVALVGGAQIQRADAVARLLATGRILRPRFRGDSYRTMARGPGAR